MIGDRVPADVEQVEVDSPDVGCTTAVVDGVADVRCELTALPPGGTVVVTITGLLAADAAAGELANVATVLADTDDPDLSNNTATAEATVPPTEPPPTTDPTVPPTETPPTTQPTPTGPTPTTPAGSPTAEPTGGPTGTQPPGPPGDECPSCPPLPDTGVPVAAMIGWALLILLIGAGLTMIGRRSSRTGGQHN